MSVFRCAVRSPSASPGGACRGFLVAAPDRAVCGSSCTGFVPSRLPRWQREQRLGCQDLRTCVVDFTTAIPFELWLEGMPAFSQRQYVFEVSEWWLGYGHSCWSWQRDLDRERLSVSDPAPENFPWLRSNYHVMDSTPYVFGQRYSVTCPHCSPAAKGYLFSTRTQQLSDTTEVASERVSQGFGVTVQARRIFHDRVANFAISSGVCIWRMRSVSRSIDSAA